MTLQSAFYLTTIIMEVFAIILLAALVVLAFYIMKKVGELSDNVNRKINAVGQIVEDPTGVALNAGAAMVFGAIGQLRRLFRH